MRVPASGIRAGAAHSCGVEPYVIAHAAMSKKGWAVESACCYCSGQGCSHVGEKQAGGQAKGIRTGQLALLGYG